jgi:hypothetical protein
LNCPNCGTSNPDTASLCANCGRPLASTTPHSYTPPPPPPPTAPSASASYTPPRPPGGGSYGAPPPTETIPNYLVQSIIVTLCCCLPLGVVAIVFAAQVNSKLAAGDIAGARDASAKAKMFCWIAFGLGLALSLIWMVTGGMAFIQGVRDGMANR